MARGEGGGRPRKELSEEEATQVEALAAVLTVEQIADYFCIGRTTFFEIMNRQPEVSERYKRGRAKAIGNVAKNLYQKAVEGDTASACFYLKTQGGWRETNNLNHTSEDGSMSPPRRVEINFVSPKSESTG